MAEGRFQEYDFEDEEGDAGPGTPPGDVTPAEVAESRPADRGETTPFSARATPPVSVPTPGPDTDDAHDLPQLTDADVHPYVLNAGVPPKRGGTAVVYAARALGTDSDVAIKVFPRGHLEAVRREGQIGDKLNKVPGVVASIVTNITRDGRPWIAMKYIKGGTLDERIQRERLSITEAASLWRELSVSLAAVNGEGVVHRDIKPGNVMSDDGRWTLADFGTAELIGGSSNGLGAALSPRFAPPERLIDPGRPAAVTDDIYGVAATIYAALAGQPPFGKETSADGVAAIATRAARGEFVGGLPEMPAQLRSLLLRSLAADPANRPRNFAEVSAELAAAAPLGASDDTLSGSTVVGHPGLAPTLVVASDAVQPAGPESNSRRPLVVALAVVTVLVLAGAAALILATKSAAPPTTTTKSTVPPPTAAAPAIVAFGPAGPASLAIKWTSDSPSGTVVVVTVDGGQASFPVPLRGGTGKQPFDDLITKLEVGGTPTTVDTQKHEYCATLKLITESGYVDSKPSCAKPK